MEAGFNNDFENLTLKADRFFLLLIWAHLPFSAFIIPYYYGTWKQGLISGLVLAIFATISYMFSKGTFFHRLLNGIILISFSIIFITLQFGRIEMHFHIFGALAFLLLYRDWRIIPPAAALVAFHHAAFNYCQQYDVKVAGLPLIVFNYSSGWEIVWLHASFVFFECLGLVYFAIVFKREHEIISKSHHTLEQLVVEKTSKLQKEKQEVEAYVAALNLAAIVAQTDLAGKIISVNDMFCAISGYSRDELIGQDHRLVNSGKHDKDFFRNIWQTILSGKSWHGDIENKKKNGTMYSLDTTIVPILNKEQKIERFMAVRFDITDRKKAEKIIIEQQLRLANAAKLSAVGEMAGGVAHEINNPLTVINSNMKIFNKLLDKNDFDVPKLKQLTETVEKMSDRIAKIIHSLRIVSRDSPEVEFNTVRLGDLFEDALMLCRERIANNFVRLDLESNSSLLDLKLECLQNQLVQVFINLLMNAYDAVQNQVEKWIKLSVVDKGATVEIRIMDSGTGISVEIHNKIFMPFFSTKDIGKGTGLGLSLAHSIVVQHGGEIYLDTTCLNTCFVLRLPKVQPSQN